MLASFYSQLDITWSYLRRENLSWRVAPIWGPVVMSVSEKLYGLMIDNMAWPSPLWVIPPLGCLRKTVDGRWRNSSVLKSTGSSPRRSGFNCRHPLQSQGIWYLVLVSVGTRHAQVHRNTHWVTKHHIHKINIKNIFKESLLSMREINPVSSLYPWFLPLLLIWTPILTLQV